uniref:Hypotheticial protein n=1 Tax=Schistosoma japonicum TaxID=6182 RepID=C1LEG6_SCHJA|nr:hypotheticial protein [Schistosoma japonicum]
MFYKKFLFLFMSSLLTCWDTSAYPDFKSLHEYPEHCTAVNIQENNWEG